jgi:hypothetical protein
MSGSVPPSSRAKKRRAYKAPADVSRAADLYERFSGHDPEIVGKVKIPSLPRTAVAIGEVDGIMYSTIRDGKLEKYIHKFAKADRPLFAVSPDGKQILFVGGRYRFTEVGIVDGSDKKHSAYFKRG